jgi:hypothetical protein
MRMIMSLLTIYLRDYYINWISNKGICTTGARDIEGKCKLILFDLHCE